jgi:hypothetical protein
MMWGTGLIALLVTVVLILGAAALVILHQRPVTVRDYEKLGPLHPNKRYAPHAAGRRHRRQKGLWGNRRGHRALK